MDFVYLQQPDLLLRWYLCSKAIGTYFCLHHVSWWIGISRVHFLGSSLMQTAVRQVTRQNMFVIVCSVLGATVSAFASVITLYLPLLVKTWFLNMCKYFDTNTLTTPLYLSAMNCGNKVRFVWNEKNCSYVQEIHVSPSVLLVDIIFTMTDSSFHQRFHQNQYLVFW